MKHTGKPRKSISFEEEMIRNAKQVNDIFVKACALHGLSRISIEHYERVVANDQMCHGTIPSLRDECYINIYGDEPLIMDLKDNNYAPILYSGNNVYNAFYGTRWDCIQYIKQLREDRYRNVIYARIKGEFVNGIIMFYRDAIDKVRQTLNEFYNEELSIKYSHSYKPKMTKEEHLLCRDFVSIYTDRILFIGYEYSDDNIEIYRKRGIRIK